MLAKSL